MNGVCEICGKVATRKGSKWILHYNDCPRLTGKYPDDPPAK